MAAIVHGPPLNRIVTPLPTIVDAPPVNQIVAPIRAHYEEEFHPNYSEERSPEIVEVENEMKWDHTTITTDTNDGKHIGNIKIANETSGLRTYKQLIDKGNVKIRNETSDCPTSKRLNDDFPV